MNSLNNSRDLRHHAFVIEAEAEQGIEVAEAWVEKELGMKAEKNPDVVAMRYGLLTVEDARRVSELAAGAPFAGDTKAVIIAASRAYHEAQNALLKIFEEPPQGTYLFLVLPTLGSLLPTLRSRVQELQKTVNRKQKTEIPEAAEEFMKAGKEKRSAIIKRIAAHQSGDAVSAREEALAIVNGVEAIAYRHRGDTLQQGVTSLLSDIAVLRGYLYDRSAPVKMILEHLSLVIPKKLGQ